MTQPQPPVAPDQPPAPAQAPPAPVAIPTTPGVQPPKKSKLGLWIGIAAAAVVLVGGIIATVSLLSVSRADYREAFDTASNVRSAYSDISMVSFISTSSTDTERRNDLDKLEKARDRYNENVEALGELKAVRRDGKVRELYEAFEAKQEDFNAFLDAYVEVYDKILPAVSAIQSSYISSEDDAVAVISRWEVSFKNIDGLENEHNKQLVEDITDVLGEYKDLAGQRDAWQDDFRLYDSRVAREYNDKATELSNTIRDWVSNMRKLSDDSSVHEELNALGSYLADQA